MEQMIFSVKEFGTIVREVRKKQKLTQEDLAGLTGTGRRFIIDLESGKKTVQMGKVLQVLGALGVSMKVAYEWSLNNE